jgi:hypothetical protein
MTAAATRRRCERRSGLADADHGASGIGIASTGIVGSPSSSSR